MRSSHRNVINKDVSTTYKITSEPPILLLLLFEEETVPEGGRRRRRRRLTTKSDMHYTDRQAGTITSSDVIVMTHQLVRYTKT
jgi:hypothetical protein